MCIPGHTVMSSDQIFLMAILQKRFITFILKCLSSLNSLVNLIFHLTITNPLSSAGKINRSVQDADDELNKSISIIKRNNSGKEIKKHSYYIKRINRY